MDPQLIGVSSGGRASIASGENYMAYKAINLTQKLVLIREQWRPRVVAEMNDYQFKLVRIQGDFIWHDHKETDETFLNGAISKSAA